MGMSKLQLLHKIDRVTKELKLKTPLKKNVPGKDWWEGSVFPFTIIICSMLLSIALIQAIIVFD
jgi:hypothetical protein